jgi:hypothetical protein
MEYREEGPWGTAGPAWSTAELKNKGSKSSEDERSPRAGDDGDGEVKGTASTGCFMGVLGFKGLWKGRTSGQGDWGMRAQMPLSLRFALK